MHDLGVLGFSRAQRRLLRELRLRAIFHPGRVVSARGGRLSDCPGCPTRPNLEHAHADARCRGPCSWRCLTMLPSLPAGHPDSVSTSLESIWRVLRKGV